jgi:hypothetical protein
MTGKPHVRGLPGVRQGLPDKDPSSEELSESKRRTLSSAGSRGLATASGHLTRITRSYPTMDGASLAAQPGGALPSSCIVSSHDETHSIVGTGLRACPWGHVGPGVVPL